jgi:hypothetical protein
MDAAHAQFVVTLERKTEPMATIRRKHLSETDGYDFAALRVQELGPDLSPSPPRGRDQLRPNI